MLVYHIDSNYLLNESHWIFLPPERFYKK